MSWRNDPGMCRSDPLPRGSGQTVTNEIAAIDRGRRRSPSPVANDVRKVTLDASVCLAWLLDEDRPAWVDELSRAAGTGSVVLSVPSLFWLEVGNRLARDVLLSDDQALEAMLRLDALGLETIELDTPLRMQALRLARETGLTTYDAAYLALAHADKAPLATLDAELDKLATALGVGYPPAATGSSGRISDVETAYAGRASDPISLAAIGSALAEMRQ